MEEKKLYRRRRKEQDSLERFCTEYKNNITEHFVIVFILGFSLRRLFRCYKVPDLQNFIDKIKLKRGSGKDLSTTQSPQLRRQFKFVSEMFRTETKITTK